MIASLRWIQLNIDRFGGDPTRVTIMGHSSGGAAISLLSLSPRTEGLFHQVVMMSGFSGTTSFTNDLDFYWRLAVELGCAERRQQRGIKGRAEEKIIECMRRLDEDTLGRAYLRLQSESKFRTRPRLDGPRGLFPSPLDTLLSTRRPLRALLGTTSREQPYHPLNNETVGPSTIKRKCREAIFDSWNIYQRPDSIAEYCRRFYTRGTNGSEPQSFWIDRAESVGSDQLYHAPCYFEADSLRSRGARVYLYSFDYVKLGREDDTPFHSFDMTYLIGLHPFEFDQRDRQIQAIYANLFANFAKYGNPTPDANANDAFLPLRSPKGFDFYRVDLPAGRMDEPFHLEGVIFWNYVVPALEKEDEGRFGFQKLQSFLLLDSQNSTDSNFTIPIIIVTTNHSSTFWKVAFGLTLTALIIVLLLLFFFGAREAKRRRRQLPQDETRPILILSTDDRQSYQTF
jgi:hypothetical protein